MSLGPLPPAALFCRLACVLSFAASGVACRSKPPPAPEPSARPSAVAAPSAAPAQAPLGCQPAGKEPGLVVGNKAPAPKVGDGDDDDAADLELPFATEVGSAVALSDAFAVGGLAARDGGTDAFVGFVPFDGKPGKTLVLGAVHGDAGPPLVAADGERVLVAVENSDASGKTLEIFAITRASDKPERGIEVTGVVGDEGAAFAVSGKSAVLVRGAGKGDKATLRATGLGVATPDKAGTSTDVPGTRDAESPLVRARPGGFWLAWIAQGRARDAGAREADASAEETRIVDASPRVLMLALLRADGSVEGSPRAVSAEAAHVVAFDAVTLADGALALAWREDDAAPGVETGGSELARVAPDGSIARGRAADEALSAGAPALLRETAPNGRTFLVVPGEDDRPRVAILRPNVVESSVFVSDDAWRGADLLAAAPSAKSSGTRFLLSRTKNRAVELSVAECRGTFGP